MPKYIDQDTGEAFPLYPTAEWLADRQRFEEEACKHPAKELRRAIYSNGSVHDREQCQRCGDYVGSSIPKAKAPANVPEADAGLRDRYQRERDALRRDIDQKHIRLQRKDGNVFRQRHRDYLASRAWKNVASPRFQGEALCPHPSTASGVNAHQTSSERCGMGCYGQCTERCINRAVQRRYCCTCTVQ